MGFIPDPKTPKAGENCASCYIWDLRVGRCSQETFVGMLMAEKERKRKENLRGGLLNAK